MYLTVAEAAQYTFTTFMQAFSQFISGIVGAWGTVIQTILNDANFILVIPIMVYVFVVATASLRSFYKG